MTTIQITPISVTSKVEGLLLPNRLNVYWPAIAARLGITMMSVTMIAQPPIQPRRGPIARVTQEKVVPQSGSARFM